MPRLKTAIDLFLDWAREEQAPLMLDIKERDATDELAELMHRVCFRPTSGHTKIRPYSDEFNISSYRHVARDINSEGLAALRSWIVDRGWEKKLEPKPKAHTPTPVEPEATMDLESVMVTIVPEDPSPPEPEKSNVDPATIYPTWGNW